FAPAQLENFRRDESPAVRMALVLALRRQRDPHLADFLKDPDPRIVLEAARAIHDTDTDEADAARGGALRAAGFNLADPVGQRDPPDARASRVLTANSRRGHADALARYGARGDAPVGLRVEALKMLGDLPRPGRRDRVTGLTQDLPPRN